MQPEKLDFDDEAKKLFARLNLDTSAGRSGGQYNPMDPIWSDPKTGAVVFVGNQSAAQNKALLDGMGVTHVSLVKPLTRIWPSQSRRLVDHAVACLCRS